MSHNIAVEQSPAGIAEITFTDAPRGNQLSWAAVDELAGVLRACRESGSRIVILASGLDGHWLQHAWLEDLANGVEGLPQTAVGSGWFEVQQELTHAQCISIAAIAGDCSGGGAEFGWACDLRIAEQQARFCQPEINMGLTTGIGGCSRLSRLAGQSAAAEMVLLGRPMSAARLHSLGAVNEVVGTGQALRVARTRAVNLAQKSPEALFALKNILQQGSALPLSEALALEQSVFQSVVVTDAAKSAMRAMQQAYDAGASVAQMNAFDEWDEH